MKGNNYFYIAIMGISSILGGLINYVYHPMMLNFMTIEDFGVFGSLIGLFNILGVLTVGFDLFLTKEFSKNLESKSKLKSMYIDTLKVFGFLGIVSFLLFSLLSPFIANFLKIDSFILVTITGITLIFSFFGISTHALLKSLKIFGPLSFNQILGPIVKLLGGVFLVFLGMNIFGAIIGFLVSGFFGILYFLFFSFRELKDIDYKSDIKLLVCDFFQNKKEIINFFLVSFFFAIFMNIDVIVVRNIFSAQEAGLYVAISVLGKFLIFLLLSIETVYFGQIMEYKLEEIPSHLIRNPIFLMLITVTGALFVNFLCGEFFLGLLKADLKSYIDIYLLILLYYGFLAFTSFFMKILIGWRKYMVNSILTVLTVALVVCLYIFGSHSILSFCFILAGYGFFCMIVIAVLFILYYIKGKSN